MIAPMLVAAGVAVAHFNVSVRAVQVVDWKQDYTATTCNGGVAELTGSGRAEAHLHTPALQPIVARRRPNGAVTLSVRGRGALPIAGSLSREGVVQSRLLQPGTGSCDCGTKRYAPEATSASCTSAGGSPYAARRSWWRRRS